MKDNFKEQFNNLKNIILTNISTLRDLVRQSEQLSSLIKQLEERDGNAALKKQLEKSRFDISQSTDVLIEQTNELFKTYEKLIEEIFGKQ
jgi:uncharacterized phage-like protein YoqJ